ncbi:MAG: hypothetical protein ACXU7D_09535 [Burkholderiaceae bacterium]
MRYATKINKLVCIGTLAMLLGGCKIDSIIDGLVSNGSPNPNTTLAWSEAATFTPDGKLYVIGGNQPFTFGPTGTIVNGVSSIYQVKKGANGKYTNTSILDGNVAGQTCYFGSMTSIGYKLYAICTNVSQLMPASVLYRVDTSKPVSDPTRIASTPLTTIAFQPNGMAADQNGDLYIPNSAAFIATMQYGVPNVPAIVKVKITDPVAFKITETGWLPALFGGYAPNGVAISGNQLYLPSMNVIYRIPIMTGGSAGAPVVVYQTAKTNLFDNVTLLPGNLIAVSEISNPNTALINAVYPGTPPATTLTTQVSLIDPNLGKFLGAVKFPDYARPSSITVSKGSLFPDNTAVVTDAIGAGGLYLIRQ